MTFELEDEAVEPESWEMRRILKLEATIAALKAKCVEANERAYQQATLWAAAEAKCVELEKELANRNLLLADAHRELDLLGRPCTCHPDDNPPVPCPRKYALSERRAAALKERK